MSSRVYLGRLSRDASKRDIERLFKSYGDIREVNLKSGFGFVEFSDERDAKDVVYDFHDRKFLGERLIVEHARGTRRHDERRTRGNDRSRSRYRLLVENIAPRTNWQDLKDMMRKAGEVTFADISRERPSEGIVEFHVRDDMEYALKKFNDCELNGQRVQLHEDSIKVGRSHHSRSRSRSPPRRHRRSPSRSRTPPRRRRRSLTPSRSRSRSYRRSSRRDDTPESEGSRGRRSVRSESRSHSRSPVRSTAGSPSKSPARSEVSVPRED